MTGNLICIGGTYISIDAIAYVKKNPDGGFTIHIQGSTYTLTVKAPFAKALEDFLNDHTVLGIFSESPTSGDHPDPLR
jgi:hypothetical protein